MVENRVLTDSEPPVISGNGHFAVRPGRTTSYRSFSFDVRSVSIAAREDFFTASGVLSSLRNASIANAADTSAGGSEGDT